MNEHLRARGRAQELWLDIRSSVAVIERGTRGGTVFYLSLLDDEIEARCERLLTDGWVQADRTVQEISHGIEVVGADLELTDALVFLGREGRIVVLRGGSCTFPLFWSRHATGVHVSTVLPVLGGARLSRAGLAAAVASVCLHGSYEPNAWLETALPGWRRVRRGAITIFEPGSNASEQAIVDRMASVRAPANGETVAERVRDAFAAYAQSQHHVNSSVLELSGGFDSTLAGNGARTRQNVMRGISVEFPYYEFRLEAAVQLAVAEALRIPRTVLDGTQLLPYAPPDQLPRFDEPAVYITGIRHAEQVARFAASHGATRIYVGHGGDQLFSTDLTTSEPVAHRPARALFSDAGWHAVRQAIGHVEDPAWRRRSTSCFVYDGRQDVWVKEAFGVSVRTPFSDLAVFRAAELWSHWSRSQNAAPDKTILAQAVGGLLPTAVTERHGKVAYDGVWIRAYHLYANHIAGTLNRASAVLEHIGVSPSWLLRRVRQLADWQPVSDREVVAGYAVACWLISWGIEHVADVRWE